MYHNFFTHSSVNGHLGGFHVLTIANSAAMIIWVHMSFIIMVFSGYMPSSGIARSYGTFIPGKSTIPIHLFSHKNGLYSFRNDYNKKKKEYFN